MMTITTRPSTTARVSRKARSRLGSAAHGGHDGNHRIHRSAQGTDEELALELKAGDEEEQGQCTFRSPVLHVEGSDLQLLELHVAVCHRGVRPDHSDRGCDQDDRAAYGLLTQHVTDERALALGGVGKELGASAGCGHRVADPRQKKQSARITSERPTRLPGTPLPTYPNLAESPEPAWITSPSRQNPRPALWHPCRRSGSRA